MTRHWPTPEQSAKREAFERESAAKQLKVDWDAPRRKSEHLQQVVWLPRPKTYVRRTPMSALPLRVSLLRKKSIASIWDTTARNSQVSSTQMTVSPERNGTTEANNAHHPSPLP